MDEVLREMLPGRVEVVRGAGVGLEERIAGGWKGVRGKGGVYLMWGREEGMEEGKETPLLLAMVGDLRAGLRRRLEDPVGAAVPEGAVEGVAPAAAAALSKRVAYHEVCTRVDFCEAHSAFAMNWVYLRAARMLYPGTYREVLPFGMSWWLTVGPGEEFPRIRATQGLGRGAGSLYAGPVRDRVSANKLVDGVEDLFDLCREYPTLLLAPRGRACAYKEMGKCPAPCDGSVGMEWYREQVAAAWRFVTDRKARAAWRAREGEEMRAAAAGLAFERAGRIKGRLERAGFIEGDAYGQVREVGEFSWVVFQKGRTQRWVEVFVVHGGRVTALGEILRKEAAGKAGWILERVGELTKGEMVWDEPGVDLAGLVAYCLFRRDGGIWLRAGEIGVERLVAMVESAGTEPPSHSAVEPQPKFTTETRRHGGGRLD